MFVVKKVFGTIILGVQTFLGSHLLSVPNGMECGCYGKAGIPYGEHNIHISVCFHLPVCVPSNILLNPCFIYSSGKLTGRLNRPVETCFVRRPIMNI